MSWPDGQRGDQVSTPTYTLSTLVTLRRLLVGAVALPLLVGAVACASAVTPYRSPSRRVPSTSSPSTAPALSAATHTANPLSRIHNATSQDVPGFARVTFTSATTFAQAVALVGGTVYPWTCDDPRTSVPPSIAEQRATFSISHAVLVEYPTWDLLLQIAASPLVVSVDGTGLFQCA